MTYEKDKLAQRGNQYRIRFIRCLAHVHSYKVRLTYERYVLSGFLSVGYSFYSCYNTISEIPYFIGELSMVNLKSYLPRELLWEITELCIEQMLKDTQLPLDKLTPVCQYQSYQDTLQYHEGKAFIHYNTPDNSSHLAIIDFDISINDMIC